MASSGLGPRQHPQIMAVPYPSLGPTIPTTLDLHQARFGRRRPPLPQDLVLTVSAGDDPPSGAGTLADGPSARVPSAGTLADGPSAPVTVGAMEGDSDMEILDDDRPLPSSVSSCLQTHPPPHQEAHDFLSSLVSSWSPRGRAYGRGMGQSIRRERDCVLKLGPSILPGVPWSRRFLTSTFSTTPPCPNMVIPLARQLLSKTLLRPKARVGSSPRLGPGPPRDFPFPVPDDLPPLSGRQKRRRRQLRNRQIARGFPSAPLHHRGEGDSADGRPLLTHDPSPLSLPMTPPHPVLPVKTSLPFHIARDSAIP
jgi:hypothetical protein